MGFLGQIAAIMLAVGRLTAYPILASHSRQPCFTRKRQVNVATLLRWNNTTNGKKEKKKKEDILLPAEQTSPETYAKNVPRIL